ncbi:isopeptide-forming domain-containing fimbrial protein [Bifidobacterium sp. MA2]|uniref:Isopeptide-forming domain-containing fimbrial protein n=1 Tax=Bifidobacterium santillanense TaxID=2809028 RepID=A0ABS5UQ79_9BIFI|nr:SpaA isopeptide-forming pilin-related protein [Bifidobacterium santillanense]MBT1173133.1 isopeptide-forming domain-containing fimbrial protein [Bifidobacterium santillanense]
MFTRSHSHHATVAVASRVAAAVITASALVAALSVPVASASPTADPAGTPLAKDSTATLVVRGVESGTTSVAYRVIELNLEPDGTSPAAPPYVWAEPVRAFVREYDEAHDVDFITDEPVAGAVGDAYAALESDPEADPRTATAGRIADFADRLAQFVGRQSAELGLDPRTGVTSGGSGSAGESDDAVATFAGLPLGGHLVLTTGGAYIHRPVIANLVPEHRAADRQWVVAERVEIDSKRSLPSVDKSINEQRDDGHLSGKGAKGTGSDVLAVGDAVTFDLRADVPVFPNNATHRDFTIADTLSDGLTFDRDSIEVFGVAATGEGGADVETPLADDAYGLTVAGEESGGTDESADDGGSATPAFTFRIDLGGERYAGVGGYRSIHVRYRAIVNERVVIGPDGNPNEVLLEYSNNPYHDASHGTDDDHVTAYSYGIEALKTGGDGKPLSGAVFALGGDGLAALAGGDDGAGDDAGVYEGVVPVGPSGDAGASSNGGRYRLPRRDAAGAIVAEDRDRLTRDLTVADDGTLWISGLRPGTYALTETKAPDGYGLLGKPVEFTIRDAAAADGATGVEFTGDVVGQRTAGYAYGAIRNYRGWLPQTGSTGVLAFSAAGLLMVLGGLVLVRRRRR